MQSEGSEWRRLYFNSGGIRGKKEAGFTKGTGFFCLCPAAARAQSIMSAVRGRAHACRAGGRGGAGGALSRNGPAGSLGTPPSAASRRLRRALACDRGGRSSEIRAGTVQRQNKARKRPPKCLKKWPLASAANVSPFPPAHRSRMAPSLLSPGPSLACPALSLVCPGLPWLLSGDPAPSLVSLAPPLATLVLLWCRLVLLWCPLLLP